MQLTLIMAALIATFVGVAHSLLGEKLVFSRLRQQGWVPSKSAGPLHESHVRIIWASWHALTVFGFVLAALLLRLAWPIEAAQLTAFIQNAVFVGMVTAALLVLVGTKGRHPGWLGLLLVGVLSWLAR